METQFICLDCGSLIEESDRLENGNFLCPGCNNEYEENELEEYDEDEEEELPDGYEAVCWPKSQYLMEHEDFQELELLPISKYGPCAYKVDSDWLKENFPNLAN